jgi:outer membrane receptor protein involved in Fe transport
MFRKSVSAVFFILATSLAFSSAHAQIEEIIVTATKRPQTLQEIPVAVTVVDSEVIERAQINDILDLQSTVPSLRVTQLQTSGNVNFIIRGFGNGANNLGIEPSVGVFIDGVYRSRTASALADMPRIERVEVLRGPQSTLFGKNASAGVINVVTAEPNLDAYEGSASLVYGNYNQVIVRGDINGPISDTFAWGLSGSANERDGYFTNLVSGSDINERSRWGVRGQLLWVPTDTLSFRFIADTEEIDEKCCGVANLVAGPTTPAIIAVGGNIVPNDAFAREQYYDFDPTNVLENSGASLQIDWDFANEMLLTSITAFRTQSRDEDADVDFTSAQLISDQRNSSDVDTFTQELRLSQSRDSLDWMLGAYYFDESLTYNSSVTYDAAFRPYGDILSGGGVTGLEQSLAPLGIPPGTFFATGQGVIENTSQDDNTISLFGQFDWHVTDRLTLTLGANYTEVDKDASVSQTNTDVFSGLDFVTIGAGAIFQTLIAQGVPPAQALAIATALSTVDCTPTTAPNCNPVLGLQPLQFLPPFVDFPNVVEPGTTNDSQTTWTARIAWDATDTILLYASAGTGFKATSWNLSRDSRPFPEDVAALEAAGLAVNNLEPQTRYAGPEDSTVYELGFKGSWDTLTLNVAVFDQEIEGFQSNIFIGTGFTLKNAGKQSTTGVEVDAFWAPTDSLEFTFAGTWLDPLYDSFPPNFPGDVDLTGTKPAGIPDFAMVTSGTWNFNIGSAGGFIRAEYIYEDEVQVVENIPASIASREVSMVNASAGITFSDRYDVMVWGRNLTDDDNLISAFPSVAQAGSVSGYPNQPRTYGVTLRARFD